MSTGHGQHSCPALTRRLRKLAQRILINPRKIDYHTGVLATKVTPGARPTTTLNGSSRALGVVLCNRHAGQSWLQISMLYSANSCVKGNV